MDDLTRAASPRSGSGRDPAPRIVPQPENRNLYKAPFLLSLVFSPITLVFRLLSGSFSLLGSIFPFLPRLLNTLRNRGTSSATRRNTTGRRPLNPRDTAARFIREFEEEYGSHSVRFFDDGYAQAYDQAKNQLKYLLVILISPEHDDNATFIRETLLSSEFAAFANDPSNNLILWAGSVRDSEAYQVSIALNCSKFPFAGLIVHTPQDSSTAMSTVARLTGLMPPATFVSKLRATMSQYSSALERIRAQRAEQQATRNLRQEQESAYERSLAQDRERLRLRREEEAAQRRAEEEQRAQAAAAAEAAEQFETWRRWRAVQVPAEPTPDVKDSTRLSIRLADGTRIVRKFASATPIEHLYAFVECHDLLEDSADQEKAPISPPAGYQHTYRFRLVSPMPRAVFDVESGGSVGERVGRSANLIVESIVDEDDEDDDDENGPGEE